MAVNYFTTLPGLVQDYLDDDINVIDNKNKIHRKVFTSLPEYQAFKSNIYELLKGNLRADRVILHLYLYEFIGGDPVRLDFFSENRKNPRCIKPFLTLISRADIKTYDLIYTDPGNNSESIRRSNDRLRKSSLLNKTSKLYSDGKKLQVGTPEYLAILTKRAIIYYSTLPTAVKKYLDDLDITYDHNTINTKSFDEDPKKYLAFKSNIIKLLKHNIRDANDMIKALYIYKFIAGSIIERDIFGPSRNSVPLQDSIAYSRVSSIYFATPPAAKDASMSATVPPVSPAIPAEGAGGLTPPPPLENESKYQITENLFLVHPDPDNPNRKTMDDFELQIRKNAVLAILETYTAINTNHTPADMETPPISHLEHVSGWIFKPIPVNNVKKYYKDKHIPIPPLNSGQTVIQSIAVPEFNKPLKTALEGLHKTSGWQTECRFAMQFVEYAIFDKLYPDIKKQLLLSTDNLDNLLDTTFKFLHIKGYNSLNIPIIKQQVNAGWYSSENGDKRVLNSLKAQRMIMLYQLLRNSLFKSPESDNYEVNENECKPGDEYSISGHPDYSIKYPYGAYHHENVFFVGYNAAGEKLYMGFGNNFMSASGIAEPKTIKDIQIWLALFYIDNNNVYDEKYTSEIKSIFEDNELGGRPSPFAEALYAIKYNEKYPRPQFFLNIDYIKKNGIPYNASIKGGNRIKNRYSHKLKRRSTRQQNYTSKRGLLL